MNFQDREHPAHSTGPRVVSSHHGQRIFGFMCGMFKVLVHPFYPSPWPGRSRTAASIPSADADHVWNVVPIAFIGWCRRWQCNAQSPGIAMIHNHGFGRANSHGCFRPLSGFRDVASVCHNGLKVCPCMWMALITRHARCAHAPARRVWPTAGRTETRGIKCKNIEVGHHIGIRTEGAGFDEPFI